VIVDDTSIQFANFGINNPIKADWQLEIIRSPTGDRQLEPGGQTSGASTGDRQIELGERQVERL